MTLLERVFFSGHGKSKQEKTSDRISDRELTKFRSARRRAADVSDSEMRKRQEQTMNDFAKWHQDMCDQPDNQKKEAAFRAADYYGEKEMNEEAKQKANEEQLRDAESRE